MRKPNYHQNRCRATARRSNCPAGKLILACGLAVASALVAASHSRADWPWRKSASQPTPPPAPDVSALGTTPVDLSKAYDPNAFRKDVTTDQQIHVHLDFGRVFESQGNVEAALAEYQQALAACEQKGIGRSRSADEALAHRRIGNAYDRLGRFSQAELHYKKALRLSSRDPRIWNDAGYSYYLQGRWADAERTLKTGMKLAPDDVRLTTNLGLTLAAAGRSPEALPLLSQYSGDAVGHANLGFLLAATGQLEMARQQYLQALALRPSLELARRALAQLDRARESQAVASTPPPPQDVQAVAAGLQRATPAAGLPPEPASAKVADAAVLPAGTTKSRIPPPRHFDFAQPSAPPLTGP